MLRPPPNAGSQRPNQARPALGRQEQQIRLLVLQPPDRAGSGSASALPGWRAASRRGGGGPSRVSSGATPPQERWGGGWRGEAAGRALAWSRRRGRVVLVSERDIFAFLS